MLVLQIIFSVLVFSIIIAASGVACAKTNDVSPALIGLVVLAITAATLQNIFY